MKKFILLLLILPLTLLARPQKIWLKTPLSGFVGSVTWSTTTNCRWSTNSTSFETYSADDDCDNNTRTKSGKNNITDVTCTDGAAGGCDGSYLRIKFSKLKAGVYKFIFHGHTVGGNNTTMRCDFRFFDGTNSTISSGFSSNGYTSSNSTIIGWHEYTEDVGEVTWSVQAGVDNATYACNVNVLFGLENATISVWYIPPNNEYIITK